MADHDVPDYGLEDELTLDLEQTRSVLEPTRAAIIDLLSERAATTSELSVALGRPKGTIGHHCKALEALGLIRVVRTRQVRAILAKYYGRTARTFTFTRLAGAGVAPDFMLIEASEQIRQADAAGVYDDPNAMTTIRYARIPLDRAAEWGTRLHELALEFGGQPRGGDRVYGLAVALYPTVKPAFNDEESQ